MKHFQRKTRTEKTRKNNGKIVCTASLFASDLQSGNYKRNERKWKSHAAAHSLTDLPPMFDFQQSTKRGSRTNSKSPTGLIDNWFQTQHTRQTCILHSVNGKSLWGFHASSLSAARRAGRNGIILILVSNCLNKSRLRRDKTKGGQRGNKALGLAAHLNCAIS